MSALGVYIGASARFRDAIPLPFVTQVLDAVELSARCRWIFAPIKGAAAARIVLRRDGFPGLSR